MDRKKDEDLMNLTFYNVYKRIEEYYCPLNMNPRSELAF